MRLLLVRHGQTDWHNPKRAQGWTDVPLNDTGKKQATDLGKAIANVRIDRTVVSDLGRAQDTARALGCAFETDARLRERNYGDWEGGDFSTVNADILALAKAQGVELSEARCPNGESVVDVWNRVKPLIDEIVASDGTTLIVSHGGVLAVVVAMLIRGVPATTHSFHFTNGSISELNRRPDGHVLLERLSEEPLELGVRKLES